jgi:hypothetical protein
MAEIWQVYLKGADGTLADIVDAYDSLLFTKRVNASGAWALRFAQLADESAAAFAVRCGLWALDAQVEFWQYDADVGIDWRMDFAGFVRWQRWYVTTDGAVTFEVGGRCYNDLLNRRIISAAAGSAHAAWAATAAETVMKDIVTYQVGASAGAGRVTTGLSVEADGADGSSITLSRAYRNVLEALRDVSVLGDGDFDTVGTGAATWEFRYYDGQLGTDRSATVIFALERGNMGEPELSIGRQDEVNAVLVGGQGEGAARSLVWRTDSTLYDDSTWNRCEQFVQATNETTTNGLNSAGDKALDAGRPKWELAFTVLQTPGCAYGLHYFLGDLVTAKFLSYSGTKKVTGVTVSVAADSVAKTVETEDA